MSKQATNTEPVLLLEDDLVPIALIAVETGNTADWVAHHFGEEIGVDDVGMRAIPAAAARAFFTERAEWKARHDEERRRRIEEAAQRKVVPVGAPALEGATAMEALIAAEAKAGTYTRPSDDYGPGRGNPFQELMDSQLAEGQRQQAEKRRQIAERKRLAEVREKAKKARETADKALKPKGDD